EWREAPFWVWRSGDSVRGRVFARRQGKQVELSDGARVFAALPLAPDQDGRAAVAILQGLEAQGIRLRTRALTTTLFSRLCLADLFVHGLGGARYDEMTDRLICRLFEIPAPEFLTLSATVRLPLESHAVEPADAWRLRQQLRELDFHSERHLPQPVPAAAQRWVAEKARLIAEEHSGGPQTSDGLLHSRGHGPGYDRLRRLREVNRRLAELTLAERTKIHDELHRTQRQLAANSVLQHREYPFCLYPEEKLHRFLDHVCRRLGS
ncbi:MAG: hypothetical protein ACKV0T_10950, partial [Planctomycetales bacterium]